MKLDNTAGPTPAKVIPKCMVINARSLAKPGATSALYADLHSNKIDICFVSETWLNNKIPSHLICPDGYTISRKIVQMKEMAGALQSFAEVIGGSSK